MAGLNYLNLTKELPRGSFQGRMALTVISHKINNGESFEIENAATAKLLFTEPELERAFEDENLSIFERAY